MGKMSRDKGKRGGGGNKMGQEEVWMDIPGYEGLYQASSDGDIRSIPRRTTSGGVLRQYISPHNGYCYVTVSKRNKRITKRVHKLVGLAFWGENSFNGERNQINHIDGNKQNNQLGNLELCTQSENMKHAYLIGLEKQATKSVVRLEDGKIYSSLTAAATDVNGQISKITLVCQGKRKRHRGYHYRYLEDASIGQI